MVAVEVSIDLLIGLVLGVGIGLLASPILRAWLSWQEMVRSSREADLFGDVLERMDAASPEHVHARRPPNAEAGAQRR
jgi:hypothetical protein